MPECTLCGRFEDELETIKLEGTLIDVCSKCVKYGKPVRMGKTKKIHPLGTPETLPEDELALVENYGRKITRSRERMGLTRKEFADKINERESIIRRIERQEMEPDEDLAIRIERFLNIEIREET